MSRNNHSKTRRTPLNRTQSNGKQSTPRIMRTTRTARTGAMNGLETSAATQGTAADMLQSLDGLQQRVGSELQAARTLVMKAGESAIKTIKANPMPLALTGLGVVCAGAGIAWLLGAAPKGVANAASEPKRAGITQQAASTMHAAGTKVSQIAHDAAAQGRKLEQSVEGALQAHPIAIGGALFAAGAAFGLAIPLMKLETTWLGRESEQIISGAQKMARSTAQKVESFAKEMISSPAQA